MKHDASDSQLEIAPLESPPSVSIQEVLDSYHQVRAAVAGLFAEIGVDPTKTRESARALELNRGLIWRLTRIVRTADAPSVISDVPGRSSMQKFTDACRDRGASTPRVDAALEAIDAFEEAVNACSGDRKTLAMLMANHPGRDSSTGEQERARRKLFDGACAVWGVQAQLRFVTVFLYPDPDDPSKLSAGHVTGFVGFRRLSARQWPMSFEAVHDESGESVQFRKEPLDPEGVEEGELQLLSRFCEPSRPKIVTTSHYGYKAFELAPGPVGNEGLTTCIFGSHLRQVFDRWPSVPEMVGFNVLLTTPIERLLFDVFSHRDLRAPSQPRARLLDRLAYPHGGRDADFERQKLPMTESPVALRSDISGAISPYLPRYPEILKFVCERIGYGFGEFEGSRFEMAYPPISTILNRPFDALPRD